MGRPERPIDPGAGPAEEFASQLRELREEAGRPSYRELARRSGYSVTVLAQAAGGRRLPTLAVVRSYVRACGGAVAEWEERWRVAAARQREGPGESEQHSPYLGLASYTEQHAGLFFGRQALTADLLEWLAAGRFLAVFGPSGSGKSSLLRAGLLAEVSRAGQWVTVLLTPGDRPVSRLAERLAPLAGTEAGQLQDELLAGPGALITAASRALPEGAEMLLVVDQFEEVFTADDPRQRDRFVDALLAAAGSPGTRLRVVLGIRSDFYTQCARWPDLVRALRGAQVLVGPMEQDQLREVILKPAQQAGMTVERGLIATILAETGTEPGALPLVSHALLETWRHSPPGRLTLSAYTQAGGVRNAIASTAERVYLSGDAAQRQLLRRLFLRLVALGDGAPDTRRRATPGELASGADPGVVAALLEEVARARLVTIDDGAVQLSHEALIGSWPRLAGWLADGRDGLRVQRKVAEAAAEWARLDRDPAALYRGTPLAVAREWAGRDAGLVGLADLEREFLAVSDQAEAAEHAARTRADRRLRVLVAALAVLLLVVSGAGGVAAWQRATALAAEQAAQSGQLAAESATLAADNPDAAALAALAAWHESPTVAARSALLSTAACCMSTQVTLRGVRARVQAVALSPGGRLLAAGADDTVVHVWDTRSGRLVMVMHGPGMAVDAVAFSSGGFLAAGSADHTIWLWKLGSYHVRYVLTGDAGAIRDLAFSPDGSVLASASADGTVRLWNVATGAGRVLARGKPMRSVAFSPDGRMLAAGGEGRAVTVWDVASPARPSIALRLAGAARAIVKLAYGHSSRGDMVAAEEQGGGVLLWNLTLGARLRAIPGGRGAHGLAFTRDGTILLVAGGYYDLRLWDTATGRLVATSAYQAVDIIRALAYDPETGSLALGGGAGTVQSWRGAVPPYTGSGGAVTGLAIIPGTGMLVSASDDRTLSLWDHSGNLAASADIGRLPNAIAVSHSGALLAVAEGRGLVTVRRLPGLEPVRPEQLPALVTDVAFSADDRMLAATSGPLVTVWDTSTWKVGFSLRSAWGSALAVAFSPRGIIAAGTEKGNVVTWDGRTGRRLASALAATGPVGTVAFSPDGRLLATGGNDGQLALWDAATLRLLGSFGGPVSSISAIAFSPDGKTLASGMANGTIMLWHPADLTLAGTLTGGGGTVQALAFTPDGAALISGQSSNRIIAWNLSPSVMIRRDCQTLADDPDLSQATSLVGAAVYPEICGP
jgi:WD40 repeat protein